MKVFRKTDTFDAFYEIVGDFTNKSILDFGGNRGNLINSSNGKILEENYTCLDISQDALDIISKECPKANTIHWNRYHKMYNPTGNKNENFPNSYFNGGLFGKNKKIDLVFANSVFTHHEIKEMLYCIRQLSSVSNNLYFTYIDPNNKK